MMRILSRIKSLWRYNDVIRGKIREKAPNVLYKRGTIGKKRNHLNVKKFKKKTGTGTGTGTGHDGVKTRCVELRTEQKLFSI